MPSLSEQRATSLRRLLELSALITFVSVWVFWGADLLWGPPQPLLIVLRGTQLALAAVTWIFARRARTWTAIADASLAFVIALLVTAVLTANLRGETQSLPVLFTMIVLVTATYTTWGLRRQIILSVIAFGGLVVNLAALGALAAAFPYPLLPITLALGVSSWIAAEVDRHSRARYQTELALRESEERFRTLAEHAPVPIWMSTSDGALTYLNPAWGDLTAPWASLTRAFWRAVHTKDRERLLAGARAALAERRPYQTECRVIAPDGSIRWLALRGVPRIAADGTYEGHVGTAVDVTESKAEARDLAAAHLAAVEAGRLKSSFLATMSHEIRTPMHGIFGMTELALDTDDDAERREFLQRARSCARTLMTLLDEILDLSRIEAGRLELAHEAVDLDEVLQNAVDTVALAAGEQGLSLVIDVAPSVPTTIGGDGDRLRQVLTNLLANAVKFTEAGEVELRTGVRDDCLLLSVRDTGVGIPPEARERIFDPFTQGDRSVGTRFGGTGLGLAISKRLVTGMGGTITVESTIGVGTTFEVVIPLREPLGPTHGARFEAASGLSVLVADAVPDRRGALRRLLEAYGCRVRVVATTTEAAQAIHDSGPDIVLLDVDLGGHGGGGAAALAREVDPGRPELVLLCPLRAGARDAATESHGLVVTRPILPATLLRTMLAARDPLQATGS
jgi:PAS domain S-box-containing protein